MTEKQIRKATIADCDNLADVFIASFGIKDQKKEQMLPTIAAEFAQRIDQDIMTFYIGLLDDQAAGLGAETTFDGSSYIGYIGVLPQHWRQGLGTKIFSHILAIAKKNNPTRELFSNLGPDRVYRKFDFKDEFMAYRVELSPPKKVKLKKVQESQTIPDWALKFDKETMGFDRSKYLQYLVSASDCSIILNEKKDGFAIVNKGTIGPLIAKDKNTALQLINNALQKGKRKMIVPEEKLDILNPYNPIIVGECLKMYEGEKIASKLGFIWSFRSFASS